jgi:AmmeMemoRadiSam system protein A
MSIAGAFIVPHPPLIIPAVGRGQEQVIQHTIDSMDDIAERIKEIAPDTIVITTPHSIVYSDYFHISPGFTAQGDFRSFRAGSVKLKVYYDQPFVESLCETAENAGLMAGTLGEKDAGLDHGSMIPLYFINKHFTDYNVVRLGLSGLSFADHYKLGMCITKVSEELRRRTVVIASGDLSHKLSPDGPYGFAPEGPEFDALVTKAMETGSFLDFMSFDHTFTEKAGECGLRSFIIMAGTLDSKAVDSQLLSYEGPLGVGYATASFIPEADDSSRAFLDTHLTAEKERLIRQKSAEDAFVRLARFTLENSVRTGKKPARPESLPQELLNGRSGVFVSLKKHGSLRGCIGTISPTTGCVADEIMKNAVEAAIHDPRFDPVVEDELDQLVYSVDVLTKPERIDSMDQLDPKCYGVIVTSGFKRGLLLPDLEGVDTPEEQISIALKKAGIRKSEDFSMERFRVERHR